jgi:hypothetical protein
MPSSKEPPNPQERTDPKLSDRQKQSGIDEPLLRQEDAERIMQGPGHEQQPPPKASDSSHSGGPGPASNQHVLKSSYNAYETWEGVEADCPACGQRGRLSASHAHLESNHLEVLCGNCSETLTWVWFPNKAEAVAAGDESTVTMFECMEARGERLKRERLRSPDQLPEILGDEITITWDTVERTAEIPEAYTYFKHGDVVLFRELAIFESGWRYAQVAAIFRQRYGHRLKDIVPTWGGWLYLGGDSSQLLRQAEDARAAFFPAPATQTATTAVEGKAVEADRKLSPEQMDWVLRELKIWMEEGFSSPKIEDSMLGLDWSLFVARKFPEHDRDTSFWNPPEFISYALSTLDAYATAMLAAHFPRIPLGVLTFTCRLKQSVLNSRLQLEFVTIPERGNIRPGTAMLELLNSFPELLRAKGLEEDAVYYLEGEGCPMQLAYPGQMLVKACPFLRDRPLDLWPEVTLRITPTQELVIRAQSILEFVWNSASIDGDPN